MIEREQTVGLDELFAELARILTVQDCARTPLTLPLVSLLAVMQGAKDETAVQGAAPKLHEAILQAKPEAEVGADFARFIEALAAGIAFPQIVPAH